MDGRRSGRPRLTVFLWVAAALVLACGSGPGAASFKAGQNASSAVPEGAVILEMGSPARFGDGYRVTVYGVDEVPGLKERGENGTREVIDLADVEICAGAHPMPQDLVDSADFQAYALTPFDVDGKRNLVGFRVRPNRRKVRDPLYPEHGKTLSSGECLRGFLSFRLNPSTHLSAVVYDSTAVHAEPTSARVRLAWPTSTG